jgi:PAS domain S-box-containing protein
MKPPGQQAERLALVGGSGRGDSLLRQAFDCAADGLAILDAAGAQARIVLANGALGRTLGIAPAELAGGPLQAWLQADSAALAQRAIEESARGEGERRVELGLVTKDGHGRWVQVLLRRLEHDADARVLATFTDLTDLTDRKGIEEAAGSLPVKMFGLDRALRLSWINQAAAQAIGRSSAELVGLGWFDLFPCLAERRPIYERVLRGESHDADRLDLVVPSTGQTLSLATSLRPIRGRDGVVGGMVIMARDVGALQQARDERRAAQRRLAVLVEKIHDLITVLSRDGTIDYQSPSCQRVLGYEPGELLGRNVFDFVHADDAADLRQRFAAHLLDPKRIIPGPAEARLRHKGGGWCWLEIVATNAFDDPAVNGLVVVARSVDRRKAAEAELAANRAQLDFSLDAANIGAWDYDVPSGVHRFDARCRELVGGLPEATSVGLEALARLTHPEDLERSRRQLLRHIKGETPWYEIEYRARTTEDGPWHWVYARGRVSARAADGRVTRLSGVMMGIDERRRAETRLHEIERHLETALWGGGVGFWILDVAHETWFASDSWLALTGYTREEWNARGEPWDEIVHPDERLRVRAEVDRFLAGTLESVQFECRFRVKCGDWIWVLIRARAAERDPQGRPARVLGTTVDVTTLRKMGEFLAETQAAAKVGGWELNLRTGALTWTAETYALFETTPAAYTPSLANAFDLYEPDCHGAMQAAMAGAIERGEPFDIEVRAHTLRGRQVWLRLVGKAECAGGQAIRLYGAKQDITALKAAEQARGAAVAVQRAVTSNAPDWLLLLDPQLRVHYANRPLRGLSPEEAVGRNAIELLDPSVRELLRAACQRALLEQRPQTAETHEQMPWGAWLHLEYSAAPVVQDGCSIGLSVRVTDVTRRRQAEEQLRTQARVLETMREGVVLFRPAGEIRLANPAVGRLFGLASAALVGSSVARLGVAHEMLERAVRTAADDGAGAATGSREWLARRADGSSFLVEGVFSAVEFAGERMIIGVLQDVTDRRQLERAIIETSSFEQQRLASDLHDGLGQELTGIALLLRSAVARMGEDPATAASLLREAAGLVDEAVQNARALAHGLAPAALELGGLPGALFDLARRVRRSFGIRAQFRKRIGSPLRLDSAQANHLYRIAQESVSNAVRHGRASRVLLRLVTADDELRLEVVDNGSGMPAPERRSASGMGLRIMEYRARMLGGELAITTPRRGGTRICCRVPLRAQPPLQPSPPAGASRTP